MEHNYSQPKESFNIEISTDQTSSWVLFESYGTHVEANDFKLRLERLYPTARFRIVEVSHSYRVVS